MNVFDQQQKQNEIPESEMIVIHVFDENRNVSKDFKCNKYLIKNNMHYFEKHLSDKN